MVLVYAETWKGAFKKTTFEAVSYAAQCAKMTGSPVTAVVIGPCTSPVEDLGAYGASAVVHFQGAGAESFDPYAYAACLSEVAAEQKATLVIINGTSNGKSLAPVFSVQSQASLITNVIGFVSALSPVTVRRGAFSSKGLEEAQSTAACTVLCLVPQALGVQTSGGQATVSVRSFSGQGKTEFVDQSIASGAIPLPEADRVVSAGRGMKAPENWSLIEALAKALNASLACSKPVSDIGWRPHTEHVGQTGIQVNPQLYVAVGISGAIQHLAGVSGSKTIVVINSDPEAPFFKAADYGVVGDAFEVVPRLTEALQAFSNH